MRAQALSARACPCSQVGDASAFMYTVHIDSVAMLERLLSVLEALDDVVCVVRADMDDLMHDLGYDAFWESGNCGRAPARLPPSSE